MPMQLHRRSMVSTTGKTFPLSQHSYIKYLLIVLSYSGVCVCTHIHMYIYMARNYQHQGQNNLGMG